MTDQPVTFGNTLTVSGNTTLNGGVNTNTIRDAVAGHPALDLSLGTGEVKFPLQIWPNKAATTVNGSVAGSVSFFTPVWGTALKVLIVQLNGWNSAVTAAGVFPSTIAWGEGLCGNLGSMTFGLNIGGTAQSIHHVLTLGGVNAVGTDELLATAALKSNWIFWFDLTAGGADRIVIGTTGGAAITAPIVIVGN